MENKAQEISVEEKCPRCAGRGKVDSSTCTVCGGKGVVLTETGKALLKYIQDNIRLSEH